MVSGHYTSQSLGDIGAIIPTVPAAFHLREHNFDFGPAFTYRTRRWNAFTHLLFGVSHTNLRAAGEGNGDTAFSWAWGFGGDMNITRSWAARLQIDALHTNFFNQGTTQPRVSIGAVYRFGSR